MIPRYEATLQGAIKLFLEQVGRTEDELREILPSRTSPSIYLLLEDDTYMTLSSPTEDLRLYLDPPTRSSKDSSK